MPNNNINYNHENEDLKEFVHKKKRKLLIKNLIDLMICATTAIVVAVLLTSFVLVNANITSGSMENTIMTGDRLLGLRLTYLFREPERGEVVVFRYPVDKYLGEETVYVKRIIGMPGETVEITNGAVYIDGEMLVEPYLKEVWIWENDGMTFHVPEGKYFMLGDNRNDSSDSRFWAYIAGEDIEGIRDEMSDEEMDEMFSYVPKGDILGKVYFRYWPIPTIGIIK